MLELAAQSQLRILLYYIIVRAMIHRQAASTALREGLGEAKAQEVVRKNPGVLAIRATCCETLCFSINFMSNVTFGWLWVAFRSHFGRARGLFPAGPGAHAHRARGRRGRLLLRPRRHLPRGPKALGLCLCGEDRLRRGLPPQRPRARRARRLKRPKAAPQPTTWRQAEQLAPAVEPVTKVLSRLCSHRVAGCGLGGGDQSREGHVEFDMAERWQVEVKEEQQAWDVTETGLKKADFGPERHRFNFVYIRLDVAHR